jgi:putative transposase
VPRSHPFIERLIGTLRREYLDQTFFWNGLDLRRKLNRFATYYNQRRVHAGLGWADAIAAMRHDCVPTGEST